MNIFIKSLIESFRFSLEYRNLLSMGAENFTFNVDVTDSIYSDWFIDSFEITVNKKMELKNLVAFVDAEFIKVRDIDSRISDLDIDSIVVISDKSDSLHNAVVSLENFCTFDIRVPVDNVLIKYETIIPLYKDYGRSLLDSIINDISGVKYSLFICYSDEMDVELYKLKQLFLCNSVEYLNLYIEYNYYGDLEIYLKETLEKLNLLGYNNVRNKSLVLSKCTIERNYSKFVDGVDELNLDLFLYLNDLKNHGFGICLDD